MSVITTIYPGRVHAQFIQGGEGGLANKNLVIVAEEWSPYWTIHMTPDGREEYGGVLYELLLFMRRARDFDFTVVRSPDGSWGDGGCTSANESVGMMGMVARNEVDMAIGRQDETRLHINLNPSHAQVDLSIISLRVYLLYIFVV